ELFLERHPRFRTELSGAVIVLLPVLLPAGFELIHGDFAVCPLVCRVAELFQREPVFLRILAEEGVFIELLLLFLNLAAKPDSFARPAGDDLTQSLRGQRER